MKQWGLRLMLLAVLALFVIGGILYIPGEKAYAAASAIKVAAVEYYDDNIIVFNNGNSKIYFATDTDAAVGKWDVINADSGKFTAIDISWIISTTENVIMIKGSENDTVSRVVIKEKPQRLNVSINYAYMAALKQTDVIAPLLNIMSSEGNAVNPIIYSDLEWKKGDYGKWQNTDTLTVSQLEKFLVKGTSLHFRIRALDDSVTVTGDTDDDKVYDDIVDVNSNRAAGIDGGIRAFESDTKVTYGTDYPDGTQGRRFSDEVIVRVAKMLTSNATNIDGEKFTAAIKYGQEYRITASYPGDNTQAKTADWIQITDKSVRKVSLETLANCVAPRAVSVSGSGLCAYAGTGSMVTFNGTTEAFPGMLIEIRNFATAKSAASKITEVSLTAQRELTKAIQPGMPDPLVGATPEDIYMDYFGNKYVLLTIPMASADLPYEYCIVKPGAVLDLEHASWSLVSRGTSVRILASRAAEGSTIYIREKEIKYRKATDTQAAVSYQLASTYVTGEVKYPSVPVITKNDITYIKQFSDKPTIEITLNVIGKTPFETEVTGVKLGTKIIGFDSAITPTLVYKDPAKTLVDGSMNSYKLTLTLHKEDLEAITNCTSRALTITYANGTIDKTSIKITIKDKTASGTLQLSGTPGGTTGKTKISIVSALGSGNTWVYKKATAAPTGISMEDVLTDNTVKSFTSGMEIDVVDKDYVVVYELDKDNHIIKFGFLQISSLMINNNPV